jgi:hypothetical protein
MRGGSSSSAEQFRLPRHHDAMIRVVVRVYPDFMHKQLYVSSTVSSSLSCVSGDHF